MLQELTESFTGALARFRSRGSQTRPPSLGTEPQTKKFTSLSELQRDAAGIAHYFIGNSTPPRTTEGRPITTFGELLANPVTPELQSSVRAYLTALDAVSTAYRSVVLNLGAGLPPERIKSYQEAKLILELTLRAVPTHNLRDGDSISGITETVYTARTQAYDATRIRKKDDHSHTS